jgi:hypothetical protein
MAVLITAILAIWLLLGCAVGLFVGRIVRGKDAGRSYDCSPRDDAPTAAVRVEA